MITAGFECTPSEDMEARANEHYNLQQYQSVYGTPCSGRHHMVMTVITQNVMTVMTQIFTVK